MRYKYEVSISFSGEDRDFAEAVARGLREAGVNVFYDNFHTADLWGKDLSVELRKVYHSESQYCIMILTDDYVRKMWTSFGRQQAIERLIEQKGADYVLPVRVDGYGGEVDGLSKNIGYLSVRRDNPKMVVDAFLEKIGTKGSKTPGDSPPTSRRKIGLSSSTPWLKRGFTDKEKNQFLKESFEAIISSLEELATATGEENPQFDHEMERIDGL